VPEPLRGQVLDRLRRFVDAYGLPIQERERLVDAMAVAHEWCYDVVREAVAGGHQTFEAMWRDGGLLRAERTQRWLVEHAAELRAALTRP
jgi:hypothetical protein